MSEAQELPGIKVWDDQEYMKQFYSRSELKSLMRRFREIFKGRKDEMLGTKTLPWVERLSSHLTEPIISVDPSDFTAHLKGKEVLRICPSLKDGKCRFAVIQFKINRKQVGIEIVEDEISEFAKKLSDLELYAFSDHKSKSGLSKVWLFFFRTRRCQENKKCNQVRSSELKSRTPERGKN